MRIRKVAGVFTLLSLMATGVASAQGYNADARRTAMGGSGSDSANIAADMVEKANPYSVLVLPLGLIQIFKDGLDKFDPRKPGFDPVRAIEDATNPLHWTFGRGTTGSGNTFINDLRNGKLNTNLASYVGFHIPTSVSAQGLANPRAGGTIKFSKARSGAYQGLYFGVGPYFGFDTSMHTDQGLVDLLGNGTAQISKSMFVTDASHVQLGLAYTVGWRGRIALASAVGGEATRDGVYFAYNYHIIKGYKYLAPDITVRFDTTSTGSLTLNPSTVPFSVNDLEANKGTGHASDIGVEIVKGYFEIGFGVNGIGNQVDWSDFRLKTYTLNSLSTTANTGQDFVETAGVPPFQSLTIKMPVVKTGNIGFQTGGWGALGSYTEGYNGKSFHGGLEKRLGGVWLRGGGKYTRGKWDPTYGFGFGTKHAIDFSFFGTHANLEGKTQTAMAVSFRFAKTPKPAAGQDTKK